MQKVHGAEQIAAERDKENKENNVVSDITVGNVCKQQWNGGEKNKTNRQNKTRYKTEFKRN